MHAPRRSTRHTACCATRRCDARTTPCAGLLVGGRPLRARYRPAPPPVEPLDPIERVDWVEPADRRRVAPRRHACAPFMALSTLYYLLPGPYEWERGRKRISDAVSAAAAGYRRLRPGDGSLAPLIGHSLNATLLAWAILALLSLPTWGSLPRVVMAGAPSALLMTGVLGPVLRQASMPGLACLDPAWRTEPGPLGATVCVRHFAHARVCFLLAHTA